MRDRVETSLSEKLINSVTWKKDIELLERYTRKVIIRSSFSFVRNGTSKKEEGGVRVGNTVGTYPIIEVN